MRERTKGRGACLWARERPSGRDAWVRERPRERDVGEGQGDPEYW